MTQDESIGLAKRAIRLCAEDGQLSSFAKHEKTILDNENFIYWLVTLSQLEEREACAKVCEEHGKVWAERMLLGFQATLDDVAKAIRARGHK